VWDDGDEAYVSLLLSVQLRFRLQSVKACASSFTVFKAVLFYSDSSLSVKVY
jgi:hypothetical protein